MVILKTFYVVSKINLISFTIYLYNLVSVTINETIFLLKKTI